MAEDKTAKRVKHREIEEDLLVEITSGRLAVGQRIPTGGEVCKKYGVSLPTADKAITNLVAKGYLKRNQRRGTFVRDWPAASQNNRQADSIAFICSNEDLGTAPFYVDFMHHAGLEAEKLGYHLVFSPMGDEGDCSVPLILRRKQAVGNLVLGGLTHRQAELLLREKMPHLFAGNHRDTFGQPSVRWDMEDAGYQMTARLLELDRGPVWLVIEPTSLVCYAQELLEGYERAVLEHPDPVYQVHINKMDEGDDAYGRLVGRMIATGQEHFCMIVNFNHVVRLLKELERANVDVNRTTITVVGRCGRDWPHLDRLALCELSPELLAAESVRQVIATAANGGPPEGKNYKLQIEAVDDRVKPFRFSWQ